MEHEAFPKVERDPVFGEGGAVRRPVDLFDPAFKANPYPTYAYLRDNAPVYRAELPDGQGMWLITRYDDVQALLKDDRFVKDLRNAKTPEELERLPKQPELLEQLAQNMLDLDEPHHTRLRGLVHQAFTPRLIEQMREKVRRIAEELLDAMEGKGEADLITEYAYPLPITVIAEMLGILAEDRHLFRGWSDVIVGSSGILEPDESQLAATFALADYFKALFAERRNRPKDDLLTALIRAEEAGDQLSEGEVLAMAFLLLIAGHETTVNLLGNGTLALLQHPEQREKLARDPGLIPGAVEELLRYTSPVEMATQRYAGETVEFGGSVIPRGELVMAVLASANRDPRRFAEPDILDVERKNNRHLAFGSGVHFCLGAPLARLEGQIGLTACCVVCRTCV
ncbi:cytochrome P450 family protein [Paenibacillus tyrfis]|uniref:cytochrome P450 family protein n=1 Tax=Paenibacillus tyrfis TaxID=1501230 RepID=UPI00209E864D|nr:cytochrome P450 [Paenibacillus tyrfis]MCP1308065.1 cytochrome P450 [Paenibacillus tyrfis]